MSRLNKGQISSLGTADRIESVLVLDQGSSQPRRIEFTKLRGYKAYSALLTQTGTNAPVATVLENTLQDTLTWTRFGVGQYFITSPARVFVANKTFPIMGTSYNESDNTKFVVTSAYWVSTTQCWVTVSKISSTGGVVTLTDDEMINCPFEIRVYN
jgi:hypothetical protein